ncbi:MULTISPECIES: hypothetical protein [unclassified Bradyrhizobium]|uniref:hypothetical protein n=1 Tax=unclassified Bradyrhizobium TaxID=2631580 RepID=UPI001FFB71A0|nr:MULTISPECIES: hypothetical protein [unclassified Bradyrhizobium]MCK1307850.1 hypothetical protein [Bradyrhizobium sp. 45]MCK1433901.1 hypothetical protein [Bradyrhizobium sp. 15]MCK1609211.1 hypothetical protein [Bradyrhizobium sp. 163]MCK1766419.1 hypothetical protein [Bradyrhizobium sp. 136]
MIAKNEIPKLIEAVNIKDLYYPFSLVPDGHIDFFFTDEAFFADQVFLPGGGRYQGAIQKALHILRPNPAERATCRTTIRHAIGTVNRAEEEQRIRSPRSKDSERAVKRLAEALNRAKVAYNDLPPLQQIHFDKAFDLQGAIEFCDDLTFEWKKVPMPQGRASHRQQAAVDVAFKLTEYWLVKKLRLREAITLTRKNAWHQLSAILFGDPKIDLLTHMTRYLRSGRKPGVK